MMFHISIKVKFCFFENRYSYSIYCTLNNSFLPVLTFCKKRNVLYNSSIQTRVIDETQKSVFMRYKSTLFVIIYFNFCSY